MRISDWSSDVCSSDLIIVNCGDGELCPDLEGFQTYDVLFLDAAYVPELTYTEAMVVMVVQGELAFRVQSDDVIVRKSVVEGKSGSVRVDLGGRGIIKKKNKYNKYVNAR